jgi:hypothetical protein
MFPGSLVRASSRFIRCDETGLGAPPVACVRWSGGCVNSSADCRPDEGLSRGGVRGAAPRPHPRGVRLRRSGRRHRPRRDHRHDRDHPHAAAPRRRPRPLARLQLVRAVGLWIGPPTSDALHLHPLPLGAAVTLGGAAVRAAPRRRDVADVHADEEPQPCCRGAAGGAVGAAVGVVASTVYETGRDAVVTVGRPHRHAANASSPCAAARQLPVPPMLSGRLIRCSASKAASCSTFHWSGDSPRRSPTCRRRSVHDQCSDEHDRRNTDDDNPPHDVSLPRRLRG